MASILTIRADWVNVTSECQLVIRLRPKDAYCSKQIKCFFISANGWS